MCVFITVLFFVVVFYSHISRGWAVPVAAGTAILLYSAADAVCGEPELPLKVLRMI